MLLAYGFDPDPRVYQEAKSLVKNGFGVTIIAWDREIKWPKFEMRDGIKIERSHIKSLYRRGTSQLLFLFLFWIDVFFHLLGRDFDIIHCHDFDTLPIGFILAKLRRKRIIFDAHESYSDMLEDNVSGLLKKLTFIIEKILIRYVDLLITVGKILEEEYKRRGAKNTCVVGNWKSIVDFKISIERVQQEKERLHIPDKMIVSFIGLLNKDRKISSLIEAVKKDSDVFLILAGEGELEKEIKEKIKGYPNIVFLGKYSPKKIPLYTNLSDVIYYVLDSQNPNAKYSAPNALFGAIACGKALITGTHGEIAKIVKEENCGIVLDDISFKQLNKAFKALNSNGLLDNYKKNAFSAAMRKYNWERAEENLLNVYKDCLNK